MIVISNHIRHNIELREFNASKTNYFLIQSLLLTIAVSSDLIITACSTKPAEHSISSNISSPAEMYQSGVNYYERNTVPEDNKKAFKLFQQVANEEYAPDQYYLGLMYYQGYGVQQDYKKTFEWFQKSASKGDADAQFNISVLYHQGIGVEKNDQKTLYWLSKAANQGYIDAQYHLGLMYEEGIEVNQDYNKAFEWYQKASNSISRLVMSGKIDGENITIYSTESTGLTLSNIE
ncbi:tetratricopeptide repeat protein [Psychrobacter aestuarii]|nr:tetratricopeptide repeat protein [Psychrobacter aestuarii]